MKAKDGGTFKAVRLPEPQTTVARCYSVIHIGTIPVIINGIQKGEADKMIITWEMPLLTAIFDEEKGPQPFVVGLELTLSTNKESNLAKLISQWRGRPFSAEEQKGFDPSVMIGKKCMLQFIHKRKKKYASQQITEVTNENTMIEFNSIMQLPKQMECPPQVNESYVWDWEPIVEGKKPFDQTHFEKMPKWLQEKVKTSAEFKKYGAQFYISDSDNSSQPQSSQAPAPAPSPAAPVADGSEW
jgi:hypothetical protein